MGTHESGDVQGESSRSPAVAVPPRPSLENCDATKGSANLAKVTHGIGSVQTSTALDDPDATVPLINNRLALRALSGRQSICPPRLTEVCINWIWFSHEL